MAPPIGRREANKQATRQAILDAARLLFDRQGYDGTTVRDIAEAAGVTERTFFRYFESKEELTANQTLALLPILQAAIVSRPAAEPPLRAVREALLELGRSAETLAQRPLTPLLLFQDGPPAPKLRRSAALLLTRFEAAFAEAIRVRLAMPATGRPVPQDIDYRADVLSRAVVSACRSAYLRDWQLRAANGSAPPPIATLLAEAFDILIDCSSTSD
jgi:AcrR family transcriptional regulator